MRKIIDLPKDEWRKVCLLFAIWLLFLSLVTISAGNFLPFLPSFPYADSLSLFNLPIWLTKLAHFDGVHYLTISQEGYFGRGLIQAFFPLYPVLMSLLNILIDNYLLSGLLLSHAFAGFAFISFYYLVKLNFDSKTAWLSLLIFAFFSSSFFLRSLYSESLFLSLIFLSLISAKKEQYLLAGILGALASATRVVGIFIWPTLILLVWLQNRRFYLAYLAVSLSSLGLLAYMLYLQIVFGDPLYFFHLQEQFGASRQTDLILLPQVIYRYLKILWTVRPLDLKYFAYAQEFFLSILALLVLLKASLTSWKNKHRQYLAYLLFAWFAYLLPPLTGNFSSMPRYLLACFPIFIELAKYFQNHMKQFFLYLTISVIFLIINLILFSQGYWVA